MGKKIIDCGFSGGWDRLEELEMATGWKMLKIMNVYVENY
jgi:hypothetical protein